MNKSINKNKAVRYARYAAQTLGIVLTAIGFFTDYPLINTILLGTIFIMGPVFCGWICPFGTLQDVFGRIGRKLGIKKHPMPRKIQKVLVLLRYVLLFATILISMDFIFNIMSLDPRANFTTLIGGKTIAATGWTVIFAFLAASIFFDRPFCNYFCIEGAKFGLISVARPITISRNEESCVGCNKCNKACPMNIDVLSHGQVRSLQCINCMECISACPIKDTLKVEVVPFKKILDKKKLIVVSAVAVAAAVLLVLKGIDSTPSKNNQDNIGSASGSEAISDAVSTEDTLSEEKTVIDETNYEYGDALGISDGVYTGTGEGFRGDMTVEVFVENQMITQINVTQTSDDAKWFNRAYTAIVSSIIDNQTADVEVVSGATYSSIGIKEGVADALIDAGGENVAEIVNDLPVDGGHSH